MEILIFRPRIQFVPYQLLQYILKNGVLKEWSVIENESHLLYSDYPVHNLKPIGSPRTEFHVSLIMYATFTAMWNVDCCQAVDVAIWNHWAINKLINRPLSPAMKHSRKTKHAETIAKWPEIFWYIIYLFKIIIAILWLFCMWNLLNKPSHFIAISY
jgi:hypothetical protein